MGSTIAVSYNFGQLYGGTYQARYIGGEGSAVTWNIVPLTLSKGFSPATIAPGGTSTLTLRLGNGSASAVTLTQALTDNLPGGVTVAATPNIQQTCPGTVTAAAGSTSVVYANGSQIPAGVCTISVDVTSTTSGTVTNTIPADSLQTSGGNYPSDVSAPLTVFSGSPPTLSKAFNPASIAPGGISTLTLSLGNANAGILTLTSALTDTLPAGMTVAPIPNVQKTCPGTVTATAGAGSVAYASGASIPPGGCSISVDVTSSTPGAVTNSIPSGSLLTDGGSNAADATAGFVVAEIADMTAALSGFPDAAAQGQPVTGTLTCTNAGPYAAATPTCAATGLPPGAEVICSPNPAPASLPVGGSIACSISYTAPATPVTLTGTAGAANDSNPANNTASGTVAVSMSDMSTALSGFPAVVDLGDPVTGTLTCINAGPDAAVNASCGATGLPVGATVVCTPTSPQASLPAGGSITCAVSYVAPDPVTSPVTITATTAAANDTNGANNVATLTVEAAVSDMRASLSGFPATVAAGEPVTGTLTCVNAGPDAAQNVVCNANGLPAGATVTCTPESPQPVLPPGAAISCAVSYTAPGTPVTLVGATSASNDHDLSNNTASLALPGPYSDLAVSLTGFPGTVTVGQTVTGTVTCLNLGPTGATGASCAVSGLPSSATVVCTPNPTPDPLPVGGTIGCAVSYTAGSGAVTVTGTANAGNDVNAANNQASRLVTGTAADMSARFSGFPPGAVAPGTPVTGTLTCLNNGPDAAAGALCNVNGLPPGASVACEPPPPVASLTPGGAISCAVTYTAPGTPVTLVGATDAANDPDTTNNTADIAVPGPLADMSTSLVGFPTAVTTGQTVTGTVTCVNTGPSAAQNAFCDVTGLPAGAVVVCTPASPQGTLAAGAGISCAVSYVAPNPATSPVTITAVTNAGNDPNTANNTAAQVVPGAPADMAVALTGFPAQVLPGDTVTGHFSCVNNGPGTATDAFCNAGGLPPGATVTCTPASPQATLPVGGIVNCAVSYEAPAVPVIVQGNTGATNDPNPLNDVATQEVTVGVSDVSAALSGFPAYVTPGQVVTGVLTCVNAGPQPAVNATCAVAGLPPGSTVTCTPTSPQASLAAGAAISCLVRYVAPATPVTLVGEASAANDANLIDNAAVEAPGLASDMSVALSGFPAAGALTPGQTYTGTVTCTNAGPGAAVAAFCDVDIPGATVDCTPASPQASLAPGQSITCAVSFEAATPTATVRGITGANNDPNASNNMAEQVIPGLAAHVSVTASGFPDTIYAGQTVTGTITCTSDGQVAATNAYCNVSGLPPGASVACTPASTAATLPVGAALVCRVTYTAPAGGTIDVVGITGAQNDPNENRHISVAATLVVGQKPIPTLSEWALILLSTLLLLAAGQATRRTARARRVG